MHIATIVLAVIGAFALLGGLRRAAWRHSFAHGGGCAHRRACCATREPEKPGDSPASPA